jgi:hypothetical protein
VVDLFPPSWLIIISYGLWQLNFSSPGDLFLFFFATRQAPLQKADQNRVGEVQDSNVVVHISLVHSLIYPETIHMGF